MTLFHKESNKTLGNKRYMEDMNLSSDESCTGGFSEKVRIFSHEYLKSCKFIRQVENPAALFTEKLYVKMVSASQLLEDFLDFHGAKNNRDWYFFRELAAAVRHLGFSAYAQQHISNRIAFYELGDTLEFEKEGSFTRNLLNRALMGLAPVILGEAERLRIPVPEDDFAMDRFPGVSTSEILDSNIDDGENPERQKKFIVRIASEYLKIVRDFDHLRIFKPYTPDQLYELVPEKVNEVEIRRFEMLVHNLQSAFDTFVIQGGFKNGEQKLRRLRGHFSVVLHLLELIGRLLHLYERHLMGDGYKNIYKRVREQLAGLVDPDMLLDRTINYGLYYAYHYLINGKKLANDILNENVERSLISVGVPVTLGFHSRPSLLVAKIVQHYAGQVELCVGDQRFDAGSVLDMQWAGGLINKENITCVTFEGDKRALNDIAILASVNYGEDTMGRGTPLPGELAYLK